MKPSAIGWCDYSGGNLNIVSGCTPVSRGCDHCYARAIYERFGRDYGAVTTHPDKLARLATQRFGKAIKDAGGNTERYSPKRGAPHKPMCFLCDTGDLFHEDVGDGFLAEVFDTLEERADVTWQVLTKRPERMRAFFREYYDSPIKPFSECGPIASVWLGVSVEDQATADERIPLLLDTPAAVRFVSVEPMLGPVDLREWLQPDYDGLWHDGMWEPIPDSDPRYNALDWTIVGAESGPNRRPFDPAWAADLRDQCREAGVAYYAKQDAGLRPGVPLLLDGVTVHEWPGEV